MFEPFREVVGGLASLAQRRVELRTRARDLAGVRAKVGCLAPERADAGFPEITGVAVCEIETLEMRTLPFESVTPEMAALEGEGDLSYRYWREAHIDYYKREGTWAPDMDVIFETFRVTRILDDAFAMAARSEVEAEREEAAQNGYLALGGANG